MPACPGCIIPWTYSSNEETYYGCASDTLGSWCPTKVTNGTYISGSGLWKWCDENCHVHYIYACITTTKFECQRIARI